MGDGTPEAIEIQCPGCGSQFRLTPKKGRLPSGDIPCPKCKESIPVKDGDVVDPPPSPDGDSAPKERSSSAPGFGVMSPSPKASPPESKEPAPSNSGDDDDPIAQLERMAKDLPANSTMAGLPGVGSSRSGGANPFEQSRSKDKTTQVDPSLLQKVAADASEPEDEVSGDETHSKQSASRKDSSAWSMEDQPETSPRLVSEDVVGRLADESSSAVSGGEDITEQSHPRGLRGTDESQGAEQDEGKDDQLRDTAENKSVASKLRETAENRSIASKIKGANAPQKSAKKTQLGRPVAAGDTDSEAKAREAKTKEAISKSSILGRIKTKKARVDSTQSTPEDSKGGKKSGDSLSPLERLKKLKKKKDSSGDDEAQPQDKTDSGEGPEGASLAKLFKKVRHKRGADSNRLKEKLKKSEQTSESSPSDESSEVELPIAKQVDISEDELAEIVDRSAEDADGDPSSAESEDDNESASPPLPRPKTPSQDDGSHDALFDDVDSPEPDDAPSSDGIAAISKKRGKTTTQSMLARLQKQRKGDDDAVDMGAAGEKRGSGYIRLPTTEIQEVLGQGDFRLKIEGIVYEPVDKDGLIKLIKGGVLLGAEQLAEGNGDWMPVSEHPVFGELRRKMASEAHHVLSRLGLQKKKEKENAEEPPLPAPVDSTPDVEDNGGVAPGPPTTKELDTSEREELRVGMTDKQFVIDADDPEVAPVDKPEATPKYDLEATEASDESKSVSEDGAAEEELPSTEEPETTEENGEQTAPPTDDAPCPPDEAPPREDDLTKSGVDSPDPEEDIAPEPAPDDQPQRPSEPTPEPAAPETASVAAQEQEEDDLETFGDQELVDAEEALADARSAKKSKIPVLIGLFVGIGIVVAGGLLLTEPGQELLEELTGEPVAEEEEVDEPQIDTELASTVEHSIEELVQARDEAHRTADAIVDDPSKPDAEAWIQQRLEEDAYADVVELMTMQWNEGRRDAEFMQNYARALIESGNYPRARHVALEGLRQAPDQDFTALHRRAITEDERLTSYDYIELSDTSTFTARGLYDQSNHHGLVLENRDKFDGTLVFKPETSDRPHNWRVEIAAWRFCELVVCHFQLFEVQPAVMTREFIDDLSGDTDGFDQLVASINWSTVEDGTADGVRGSLEYVPDDDATPFPLGGPGPWLPEWRQWVAAGGTPSEVLEQPAVENLDALEGVLDDEHYRELMAALDGVTTGDIARQISALISFDFLFNNPDRITRLNASDSGMNKPIVGSTMVARHNGDAFSHLRISRRVEDRFGWTTRHSRSTVASVRALDREILSDVLFPEATASETQLVDAIWQQRNALRDSIDDLLRQHDEDEVLHFP